MINNPFIYKLQDISPTFLNTRTTNETFQQFEKQDSFRHTLKSSASIHESSGSQFYRTTTGIQSGPGHFRRGMLSHTRVHTCKIIQKYDNLHTQIKLFTTCFYHSYFHVNITHMTVIDKSNQRCINKYFDSESYWFYTEIKKVFFSVQLISI